MERPRPSMAPALQVSVSLPRQASSHPDIPVQRKARPSSIYLASCSDGVVGEDGNLDTESMARSTHSGALPRNSKHTNISLVFPVLLLDSTDLMVVSKPSDWICSAADVDRSKGRALDPQERVTNNGFYTLDDLLNHRFVDGEKKFLHWWPQLLFGVEQPQFPSLFNESLNYGLCHRMDRETSGSIIIGLTEPAHRQMRACFHRGYIRKLYVGLLHGHVTPDVQTVDRKIHAMGAKARLHDKQGKRARTQIRVIGRFTKDDSGGHLEKFSLCLLETLEGRMHQCRVHAALALDAPLVSEFYYQSSQQAAKDRAWCQRLFLHEYAIAFPDVSGGDRVKMESTGEGLDDFLVDSATQEWHCVVAVLPEDLRDAMEGMTPADQRSERVLDTIIESGLLDESHENVHVMGNENWESSIDRVFFPYQLENKPITESLNEDANRDEETSANDDQGQARSPLRRPFARAPLQRQDENGAGSISLSSFRAKGWAHDHAHLTIGQTRREARLGRVTQERPPLRRTYGGTSRVDREPHRHCRRLHRNSRSRSRGIGIPPPPRGC